MRELETPDIAAPFGQAKREAMADRVDRGRGRYMVVAKPSDSEDATAFIVHVEENIREVARIYCAFACHEARRRGR